MNFSRRTRGCGEVGAGPARKLICWRSVGLEIVKGAKPAAHQQQGTPVLCKNESCQTQTKDAVPSDEHIEEGQNRLLALERGRKPTGRFNVQYIYYTATLPNVVGHKAIKPQISNLSTITFTLHLTYLQWWDLWEPGEESRGGRKNWGGVPGR